METSAMPFMTMNGQTYEDSSDEEPEARMRVGEMYQAQVPNWVEDLQNKEASDGNTIKDIRIWSPLHEISDEKVEAYCKIAKERHGYNVEQALGLLFWHGHDLEKSMRDMTNYTPMPEDWSVEDKVLFEQAYAFHGKSFRRIQQLLPDKEINQLVKYYYLWKKTRTKTSLMDRQARKLNKNGNASDNSDNESNHINYLQGKNQHADKASHGRSDHLKPEGSDAKHKRPAGISLDLAGLREITSHPGGPEKYLSKLDNSIATLKSQIQIEKQHWCTFRENMKTGCDEDYENLVQTNAKEDGGQTWSSQELLLAVQGVRRYGKDFEAISEVLGTKSAAQVKTFFVSQRRRFNLDQVLKEYEEANSDETMAV